MDDELKEVYVDASACNTGTSSLKNSANTKTYSSKLRKVSTEFSKSELLIAFFLLLDNFKRRPEDFLELVKESETKLREKFLIECLNYMEEYCLFELLGTMKKYKLMKEIGLCKEIFTLQEKHFKTISEKWKFYYYCCEDLSDEMIIEKRKTLLPDLQENISGEELVCQLLSRNLTPFEDLSVNRKYHIRDPTPDCPCGLAIIINQEKFTKLSTTKENSVELTDRNGSSIDKEKLRKVWTCFGFLVEEYDNLTAKEIIDLFKTTSVKDLTKYDVFVSCILSHGIQGSVYGSDSETVTIDEVIHTMVNECHTLFNKPKLFFIQACQGKTHQKGLSTQIEVMHPEPNIKTDDVITKKVVKIPCYADFYEALATYPGYVSYRDEIKGTIFVSSLVKHLEESGTKEDIDSVMKKVKNDIREQDINYKGELRKQMPVTTSTLCGHVIFKRVLKH